MLVRPTTTHATVPSRNPAIATASPAFSPGAFLRSAMPALDLAFGLEDETDWPDDIAVLTARLRDGPLGDATRETASHRPGIVPARESALAGVP